MTRTSCTAPEIEELRRENAALKTELERLRLDGLANGGNVGGAPESAASSDEAGAQPSSCPRPDWDGTSHGLSKDEIARYSRQLILHNFGVHAQAQLCRGSVLIVGAGGLGSPAALYLAAAGVGRIGIVDKDEVELSNLHRQVIHREGSVGRHKALSAAESCTQLNSCVRLEAHCGGFTPQNALGLVRQYDVVVDASDNAPTRYLISDACAVARRPLVSGAAIGMDGQLTVYCHGEDGPCYRCLFPAAPRPESCSRCCDAGVLGVVPGVIGTLQAVEAIKLLSGVGEPMSRRLLLADLLSARFHMVKLRARSPDCVACGTSPSITADTLPTYDYSAFTGQSPSDAAPKPLTLIPAQERITPAQFRDRLQNPSRPVVVVDVRPAEQFNICHLPGAIHAPFSKFDDHLPEIRAALDAAAAAAAEALASVAQDPATAAVAAGGGAGQEGEGQAGPVEGEGAGAAATPAVDLFVVCRRGNDSQRAVARLRQAGGALVAAADVVGGMEGWAAQVDPGFPTY